MATLVLVRHGRTTANASGVLAGRTPGVLLDDTGREQVARTGERLAAVPLVSVVSSPMERCRQTSAAILERQSGFPAAPVEDAINECDYGEWQGRPLKELAAEPLWSTVQSQPSAAVFPGGESLPAMQARAVEAVRRIDAEVEAEHGASAVWAAVSHGDLVKALLADALGMHLDLFQRIQVDPASISIVRYTTSRPYVLAQNTHAGDLRWLVPEETESSTDAVPGGGAGPRAADGTGGGAGPRAADGTGGGALRRSSGTTGPGADQHRAAEDSTGGGALRRSSGTTGPGSGPSTAAAPEDLDDGPAEMAGPGRS